MAPFEMSRTPSAVASDQIATVRQAERDADGHASSYTSKTRW
jgi:hypothetical protein